VSLSVALRHRLGALDLDVAFEAKGRLTALFGPSGSGKTSVVNAIAGLLRPDEARIVVDGQILDDTERDIAVPVHRRRIGYVFQDARLFPHLTVERNLGYGRWFAPRDGRYADPRQIASLLGLSSLLNRRPGDLSGGERQRVAIGRALNASPRLLLMDEPLASLDHGRKDEILPYIERLRDELSIPIVYVSHALPEVVRLATDVVVLADGKSVAAGPAGAILQRIDLLRPFPRGEEGASVLDMRITAYDDAFDMTTLVSPVGTAQLPGRHGAPGDAVRVLIRARDVMIATVAPEGISALNVFPGTVMALTPIDASAVAVTLDCSGVPVVSRITRLSAAALKLAPGKPVFAVVKAVSVAATGYATGDAPPGRLPV
jgi:molybdate transport system ATP-binding protein